MRIPRRFSFTLVAGLSLSCGGESTTAPPRPPPPPPPPAPVATTVTVTPETATFAALGNTVQLAARVLDQNGQAITNATISWASSDGAVATVDNAGLVSAVGNGSATVTAASGEASGSATITVEQVATSIRVSPEADTLGAIGATTQLSATAEDANGREVPGSAFTWVSSDTLVATVDESGLVTAIGNGSATVTAASGEASGSATITVEQVATSIRVSPEADTLGAIGATTQLSATAEDANGREVPGSAFTWVSSDTLVATVDESGLVTAIGNGTASVTAASGEASGSATITVEQVATSIRVSPEADTLGAIGATTQLSATAEDANGREVPGSAFTWVSSDTLVATVDESGLVTAIGNGTASVTAASGEASGSATITVEQVATSIRVSPEADTLGAIGATTQLSATAEDANGREVPGSAFTWVSSDTLVATVDESGLVTAIGNGTASVTAASGEASGSATITVEQVATSIRISPPVDTLRALRATLQLSAAATDAHDHEVPGVEFVWASSDTRVVTVDDAGVVTAIGTGTAAVTAVAGELSGAAAITVEQVATRIRISAPGYFLRTLGATLRLSAAATDANGRPIPDPGLVWTSSDPLVFTIDDTGLLTATGNGNAHVKVSSGAAADSVLINVYDQEAAAAAERAALVALYEATDGPNWTDNTNWLSDRPLSTWAGVSTASNGRVKQLELSRNGLSGPIPPELGNLDLTELVLSVNQLTGSIPPELGDLANLRRLTLGQNQLTGSIPAELGNLVNIELISLAANQLTGSIPPELGDLVNLESLQLGDNELTGPIPADFGRLDNLTELLLSENQLAGSIPPELGDLASLDRLLLGGNQLTGALPSELGNLANLRGFAARRNQLTGSIPPELGKLASLVQLSLDENQLTGPIPPELGALANLELLWLMRNQLTGPIPPELGRLASLERLTLSFNQLTGSIPPELGNLTNLTLLWLANNQLAGTVPSELGSLVMATYIDFSGNAQLSGPLPASFTNLTALTILYTLNTDICVPAGTAFTAWLGNIQFIGNRCTP